MKLLSRDLNPDHYLPHPTSIYTCGVTIASRVCGGGKIKLMNALKHGKLLNILGVPYTCVLSLLT